MFESIFADVTQQLLHMLNLNDAGASEGVQWILCEAPLSNITPHSARGIVSRETRKCHFFRLYEANASAKCVFLPYGPGDDFLEIHLHRAEEMLGQIRAVEAHGFVGVSSIIVIPISAEGVPEAN